MHNNRGSNPTPGNRHGLIFAIALLGLVAAWPEPGSARDFVLVIGGGPSADSNQISIEQNVLYFQRSLPALGLAEADTTYCFASGQGSALDVCHNSATTPDLNRLLARLFGPQENLELHFRHHQVSAKEKPVEPAARGTILERLDGLARRVQPHDRVLIYMTGHGGKGNPIENGHFYTWARDKIAVRDFVQVLDRFPEDTLVGVVMVQCYSGSFANILFRGGMPEKGLAPHQRVGFFATVDSRPAAGCTPDIKVEDYHEYSTYFWAALAGRDRLGQPVLARDVDRDGAISCAEAHAHVLTNSSTIDLSMKTSDLFLRRYAPTDRNNPRFFRHDRDYSRLLAVASPCDRMVLESLSKMLGLSGENRITDALRQAEHVEMQRRGVQERMRGYEGRTKRAEQQLRRFLSERWPFIRNPWNVSTQQILRHADNEITRTLDNQKIYREWKNLQSRLEQDRDEDLNLEKRWTKLHRMARLAESVALAENLRQKGDPEMLERFERLLELEDNLLAPRATRITVQRQSEDALPIQK